MRAVFVSNNCTNSATAVGITSIRNDLEFWTIIYIGSTRGRKSKKFPDSRIWWKKAFGWKMLVFRGACWAKTLLLQILQQQNVLIIFLQQSFIAFFFSLHFRKRNQVTFCLRGWHVWFKFLKQQFLQYISHKQYLTNPV